MGRLKAAVVERIAARERIACPEAGCNAVLEGLLDAETHLVFGHSYARPAARELIVRKKNAEAPAPRVQLDVMPPAAPKKERPMKKSERKCRLCRKPGHRANACPTAANGAGGGALTDTIVRLEREIVQRQQAVKALRAAEKTLAVR